MYVVLKLKSGDNIVGSLAVTEENSVDIKGALLVHFNFDNDYPAMFFSKYCLFNLSFDVTFQKNDIANIFDDPLPSMIEFYKEQLANLKENYEIRERQPFQKKAKRDAWEADEKEKPEQIFKALFEKMKDDPEVH